VSIVYQQLQKKQTHLINFIVPLAEQLIENGKLRTAIRRKNGRGRPAQRNCLMTDMVEHLPLYTDTRQDVLDVHSYTKKKHVQSNTAVFVKNICVKTVLPPSIGNNLLVFLFVGVF